MSKKLKDTAVGRFLKRNASSLLDDIKDLAPDKGILGVLKRLITSDNSMTPQDKETALKMLEMDASELEEVSKRWQYDVNSGWLSRNVRPLMISYLTVMTTVFVVLDSSQRLTFDVPGEYIELLKNLLITAYLAYFGSRGLEKFKALS